MLRYENHTVPLSLVGPCPWNTREFTDTDPDIIEFAAELDAVGMLHPITVRETPREGKKWPYDYQTCGGSRRRAAVALQQRPRKEKGKVVIDVRVVTNEDGSPIDDVTAMSLTFAENADRRDLTPFQQALSVQRFLDDGLTYAEVADRLNRSVDWVARKAALTRLTGEWKLTWAAIDSGFVGCDDKDPVRKLAAFTSSHMEQIARLPEDTQGRVLDWLKSCLPYHVDVASMSSSRLASHIDKNFLHLMDAAVWPLDDAELVPEAGACSACKKRSSCQGVLFADMTKDDDRCLDAACWARKLDTHREQMVAEKMAKYEGLRLLGIAPRTDAGTEDTHHYIHPAFGSDKLPKAKGGVPALGVEPGPTYGKIVYLADPDAHKNNGKASVKPVADRTPEERTELAEERLAARRRKWMIERMHSWLERLADAYAEVGISSAEDVSEQDENLPAPPRKPGRPKKNDALKPYPAVPDGVGKPIPQEHAVLALAVVCGTGRRHDWMAGTDWPSIEKLLDSTTEATLQWLWAHVLDVLCLRVKYNAQTAEAAYRECGRLAGLLDLPWKKWMAECEREIPVPKSLAKARKEIGASVD